MMLMHDVYSIHYPMSPVMIILHSEELRFPTQDAFTLERNIFQNFYSQKSEDWKLFVSVENVR